MYPIVVFLLLAPLVIRHFCRLMLPVLLVTGVWVRIICIARQRVHDTCSCRCLARFATQTLHLSHDPRLPLAPLGHDVPDRVPLSCQPNFSRGAKT